MIGKVGVETSPFLSRAREEGSGEARGSRATWWARRAAPPGGGTRPQASPGSTPGVVDFVSIDMDTTGNTPTVLGTREVCVSGSVGASFTIDVTVDEVAPGD